MKLYRIACFGVTLLTFQAVAHESSVPRIRKTVEAYQEEQTAKNDEFCSNNLHERACQGTVVGASTSHAESPIHVCEHHPAKFRKTYHSTSKKGGREAIAGYLNEAKELVDDVIQSQTAWPEDAREKMRERVRGMKLVQQNSPAEQSFCGPDGSVVNAAYLRDVNEVIFCQGMFDKSSAQAEKTKTPQDAAILDVMSHEIGHGLDFASEFRAQAEKIESCFETRPNDGVMSENFADMIAAEAAHRSLKKGVADPFNFIKGSVQLLCSATARPTHPPPRDRISKNRGKSPGLLKFFECPAAEACGLSGKAGT